MHIFWQFTPTDSNIRFLIIPRQKCFSIKVKPLYSCDKKCGWTAGNMAWMSAPVDPMMQFPGDCWDKCSLITFCLAHNFCWQHGFVEQVWKYTLGRFTYRVSCMILWWLLRQKCFLIAFVSAQSFTGNLIEVEENVVAWCVFPMIWFSAKFVHLSTFYQGSLLCNLHRLFSMFRRDQTGHQLGLGEQKFTWNCGWATSWKVACSCPRRTLQDNTWSWSVFMKICTEDGMICHVNW